MSSTCRFTRKNLPRELAACGRWRDIDVSTWLPEHANRYARLKEAIQRYLAWEAISTTLETLKVSYEQLLRALNRCVTLAEDGLPFGWRALLPHCRTVEYKRLSPVRPMEAVTRGGYAGALSSLFEAYPDIKEKFDKYLCKGKQPGSVRESRVRLHVAHKYFVTLCGDAKVRKNQWPFCTERLGAGAIRNYVHRFCDTHYDEIVEKSHGERAKAKSKTGTGHRSRLIATLPFDVVELDEHKAHFIGSIGIPTPKGIRWCPIGRVTLILLVDRVSEVVLGYCVIFRREAKTRDVMAAIACAVRPRPLRKLSLAGLNYPDGAGFPSGCIEGLERCGWSVLLVDNALVHLAHDIIGRVRPAVGCVVNFGAVRRFERRSIAELVFHELSRAGFHRVPSTTGSHNQDPIRQDAEGNAARNRMSMDAVLDLVELVIADYNGKRGKANFGIGGLDYLREVAVDRSLGFLAPTLPPPIAGEASLDIAIEYGRVGGNRKKGVRPHIYLDDVPYTSTELSNRWDLIGKKVTKHVDETNIQTFEAYFEDGTSLGTMAALGRWSMTPHSREARRQINAKLRSGELVLERAQDPVIAWLRALAQASVEKNPETRAPTVTTEATQLAEELRHGAVEMPVIDADAPTSVLGEVLPATAAARSRIPAPASTLTALN